MLTFSVSKHLAILLTFGTSELGITAGGMLSSEFPKENFGNHVNFELAKNYLADTARSSGLFGSV